jgi:S-adenosyl-L-methionine hydrolase (adenosine-forming)
MTPSIVFLSDFGYRNEWVGICHAVMDRIAPGCPVIDLSHGIPPLDVRAGALLLADSLTFTAEDAIALAVVDPSVGRDRDLAVRTETGRLLVGPDNGILHPAWKAMGGIVLAVSVTSEKHTLRPVAPSFHARDVLAPAAAYLAQGVALEDLGPPVDPETLAQLNVPEPIVERGRIECEVLDLNRFGNVQLNVRESHLIDAGLDGSERVAVKALAGAVVASRVATYGDIDSDQWGLMVDPRGWLSVIRANPGNAAAGLGVGSGDLVWLSDGS